MNPTTKTGREGGTHKTCSTHPRWFPDESAFIPLSEFNTHHGTRDGVQTACRRCNGKAMAARPTGADGRLLWSTDNKDETKIARELAAQQPEEICTQILDTIKKNHGRYYPSKAPDWFDKLVKEAKAQSGNAGKDEKEITPEELAVLKSMGFFLRKSGISFAAQTGNVDALAGFELVKEEKEQEPHMLTELELAKKTLVANFKCWACGKSLKGYVGRVGYEELEPLGKPEQLHYPAVAVSRKDGLIPTKEQANPGHKACNDMMASYRFSSAEQAKQKVVEQLANRGIEFVEEAEISERIIPAHYVEEKRIKTFKRKS